MTDKQPTVVILPGDGVGPEVIVEALKVLRCLSEMRGVSLRLVMGSIGAGTYAEHGVMMTDETLAHVLDADAILFGAVGGPEYETIPIEIRRGRGLLFLRRKLGLFANLRPVKAMDALVDASSLKREVVEGVDLMMVRELTGGIYFGEPRGIETLPDGSRRGVNTQVYTTEEIRRVARVGFDLARGRSGRLCSVEKSNVMESGQLWREEVQCLWDEEYQDVELTHMLADNCAMQIVRQPSQFDVLVMDNLFGDLLSDCASMVTGSLGMLPSASVGALDNGRPRYGLYEPVHGSAPDIAGRNIANPLGTILSLAMMMRMSFGLEAEATMIEVAIENVLVHGLRTADIAQPMTRKVSTSEMGDAVVEALERGGAEDSGQ